MNTKIIELGEKTYSIGVGWLYLAKSYFNMSNEAVETLAVKRFALCLSCEKNRFNTFCSACSGCVLKAKVRSSREKCDLNKW